LYQTNAFNMVELGGFEPPSKTADRQVFYMLSFLWGLGNELPENTLSVTQSYCFR